MSSPSSLAPDTGGDALQQVNGEFALAGIRNFTDHKFGSYKK
jgi:hypothetical protein